MKRNAGTILLIIYAALVTGISFRGLVNSQSEKGYIQLDTDFTWHYIGVTTPTPETFVTSTASPTVTNTPEPTDTPRPTFTPGPSPTPILLCQGKVTANTLNVRSGPGTSFSIVTTYDKDTVVNLLEKSGTWYKISNNPSMYVSAQYITITISNGCSFATTFLLGFHLLPGAKGEVVDRSLSQLGNLKGIDQTEQILRVAKSQRPDLLIIYRNLTNRFGMRDCPFTWGSGDASAVADVWWDAQYNVWKAQNLLSFVDYFELLNECGTPSSTWDNTFWQRVLDHAKINGVCLALYSESYGSPEPIQYQYRTPVLDRILIEECQPGRHHIIALHIYEGVAGGDWKFGRWRLFLQALGPKYSALRWYVSEYGYAKGTGTVDCAAFRADWTLAEKEFAKNGDILGAALFGVSEQGQWSDFSPCF